MTLTKIMVVRVITVMKTLFTDLKEAISELLDDLLKFLGID